jgi:hypothetical protein
MLLVFSLKTDPFDFAPGHRFAKDLVRARIKLTIPDVRGCQLNASTALLSISKVITSGFNSSRDIQAC